jgi:hypothetical protein
MSTELFMLRIQVSPVSVISWILDILSEIFCDIIELLQDNAGSKKVKGKSIPVTGREGP